MRAILTTLAVAALALGGLLGGCGSKVSINGTVQDVDGNPIADAAAAVVGTTDVSMSDATGVFSVSTAPGDLSVSVGKLGYLSYSAELVATEAGEADLGTIQLQPTPPSKGLWLYDSGAFTQIARTALEHQPRGKGRQHCLPEGASEATIVPAGDVVFFDYSHMERHLVRLTEGDCAGVRETERWILDDELGEKVEGLTDDMKLRRVTLTPGRYVYADWTNGWFRSEASLFEVK
jgi:hypothetical protein